MKNYFHEDKLSDTAATRVLVEYRYKAGTSACISGPLVQLYDGVADELAIVAAWLTDVHGQVSVFTLPQADCVRIEALLRKNPPETNWGRQPYR